MKTVFDQTKQDSKNCKCGCHISKAIEAEKWGFEIKYGTAVILREERKNLVGTQKYTIFDFIPKTIIRFFLRGGNLIYLFVAIVLLTQSDLAPFQNWMMIFFVCLMLFIYMVIELFLDLYRRDKDLQINRMKINKAWKESNGDIDNCVNWSDLDIGDIICLRKDEIAPADIIILDTSEIFGKEAICYVDTSSYDGISEFSRKKAASVSQIVNRLPSKGVFKEYRKNLSGVIDYEGPNSNPHYFSGFLRLKKDPKIERLDNNNFIARGSILKNAAWIYGMVVFTGADTKIHLNSNYSIHKKSFLETLIQYYFYISASLVIIFGIINTILVIAAAKDSPTIFLLDSGFDDSRRFFIYVILYSPLMPIFLYGFIDIISFLSKKVLESKLRLAFNSSENICVNNPFTFSNITQAEYVLLDKTGTISKADYKVHKIYYNNKIYRLEWEILQREMSNMDKMKIFNSPFKNITSNGNETMFANNLMATTTMSSQSQIYKDNKKDIAKKLAQIEEKDGEHLKEHDENQTPMSIGSRDGEINTIPNNFSFHFEREIEAMEDTLFQGGVQVRNSTGISIVKKLYGEDDKNKVIRPQAISVEMPTYYSKLNKPDESPLLSAKEATNDSILPFRKDFTHKDSADPLSSTRPLMAEISPGMPIKQLDSESVFHEKDFLQDLLKPNVDDNLDNLFEAFTLCHPGKAQPTSSELCCAHKEDEVLLDFSRKCYFVYDKNDVPENPSQYYFKYKNNKFVYNIIGINDFYPEKKSFSVVYKTPFNDNEVQLICKGEELYMRDLMNLSKKDLEVYDNVIREMHNEGLKKPIIYARRTLEMSEAQIYYSQIRNLKTSVIAQDDELCQIGQRVENNMELLAIIGLKEDLKDGTQDFLELVHDLRLNLWLLTGDTKENALTTSFAMGMGRNVKIREIVADDQEILQMIIHNLLSEWKNIYAAVKKEVGTNPDELNSKSSLTRLLSKSEMLLSIERQDFNNNVKILKGFLSKMKYHCIVINGKSLDTILNNEFLKSHFIFLISFVKKVIGYDLQPQHKAMLVDIIQSEFVNNPSVLAIGQGFKDTLMMQKATFAVEIIEKNRENALKSNAGDLSISNLKMLRTIMVKEGILRSTVQDNLIVFLFYQSFLLGFMLFLFFYVCPFRPNNVYFTLLVVLYFILFSAFNVLVFGLYDKPYNEEVLDILPSLYKEGVFKKRHFFLRFFVKSVMEAIGHSGIIFVICYYGYTRYVDQKGHQFTILVLVLAALFSLIVVHNIKLFTNCTFKRTKLIFLSLPACILSLVFYVIIVINVAPFGKNWTVEIAFIFNNFSGYMLLLFNLGACYLYSFLLDRYIVETIGYSLIERLREIIIKFRSKRGVIEGIFSEGQIPTDISMIVKHIFRKGETLNPAIQEMFSSADVNVNEIELNRYSLTIQNRNIENKYNFLTKREYITKFILIFLYLGIIMGVYSAVLLITKDDKTYGIVCVSLTGGMLVMWLATLTETYAKNYYSITRLLFLLSIIAKIIVDWIIDYHYSGLRGALVPHISTINLNLGISWILPLNFIYLASYFSSIACMYYNKYPNVISFETVKLSNEIPESLKDLVPFFSIWTIALFISAIAIISIFGNYKFEKLKRAEYLAKMRIEQEGNNIQDILTILVPKFVKDRMNQGLNSMQEAQDDVGILFCDICDFDKIINSEGIRIVQILDEIFRNFDNLCLKHGIQKIETVGKTYMACAGLKLCEVNVPERILKTEKTRRMVSMALEMMKYIASVTYGKGEIIKMKIGIHNGRVITGVIGDHKPQFSLIGDTVNTTSRVCSTGQEGSITISEEAYHHVKNSNIVFIERIVQAKGKGDLVTYQVSNQKFKRKVKESKLKLKIESHMPEIRNIYEKMRLENKQVDPKYNKAVNLMTTWLVQKQIEDNEETRGVFGDREDKEETIEKKETEKMEKSVYVGNIIKKSLVVDNKILLTFSKNQVNQIEEFQHLLMQRHKNELKLSIFSLLISYMIHTFLIVILKKLLDDYIFILCFRGSYVVLLAILLFVLIKVNKRIYIRALFFLLYFYGTICTLVYINMINSLQVKEIGLLELVFVHLIFVNSNFLSFIEVILLTLCGFAGYIIVFALDDIITEQSFLFIFLFYCIHLIKIHLQICYHLDSHNNLIDNDYKRIKQNSLVSQLLPIHAFEKLKHISLTNKLELTDNFKNVTILFADIVNFTKYSSSVRPEGVVDMLTKLFTKFDKECVRYKVYKVYTIGDCYVVLGFINANQRNPVEEAKNVVKMGLSMIEIIRIVRTEANFNLLDMRIGIHTGDIIGGIIGTDIVRYDIYGKDVLLANKMESNGTEGNIMVSETTKNILEKDDNNPYSFEYKKHVESKVLENPIAAYLIHQK